MSQTKHTASLLRVDQHGGGRLDLYATKTNGLIVACLYDFNRTADARRFAALWNEAELTGLSTEAIEGGLIRKLLDVCNAALPLVEAEAEQRAESGLESYVQPMRQLADNLAAVIRESRR
jgi:hypothetical protein